MRRPIVRTGIANGGRCTESVSPLISELLVRLKRSGPVSDDSFAGTG